MFKLFRYFSIASAVAIIVVTVILVVFYRQHAIEELVEEAESDNVVLARTFSNILWPNFSSYITSVSERDGDLLRGNPETQEIHAAFMAISVGVPVLKVKIYNLDGITIYSSERGQIGGDKSDNLGFLTAARHGKPASKLSYRNVFSAFSGEVYDRDLVESYLPIRGADGTIAGVFELYTDVSSLVSKIDRITLGLVAISLFVFGSLYAFLALIVWHADRVLKRQYAELKRSEEDIKSKNVELEFQIAERNSAETALQKSHDELEIRVLQRTSELRHEITEHEATHTALREREAQLSQAQDIGLLGHWTWMFADNTFESSEELRRIYRLEPDALMSLDSITDAIHADDKALAMSNREAAIAEKCGYDFAYRILRPNGETGYVEGRTTPLFDEAGEISGFFGVTQDVSERKRLETVLRESTDQLRQSQRLEAVGQLTGGIAHDFNNILAAIIGHLDLLQDSEAIADEFDRKGIATALRAALRGAELTHHLLAFARQQELDAKVTEINQMLPQFGQLAQRTIGEDVTVEMKLAADLWSTMVDAGQLESALLNLAINARDAMPDGGQLTVETANKVLEQDDTARHGDLTPGDYVIIAVSDTGTGMPAEVRERVFEPFFTTKAVGEGSGLGLSMVFGFAKQSGGHVSIASAAGAGTMVRIYLPRAEQTADAASTSEQSQDDRPTGDETILVVEDDNAVREYLVTVLGRLGYTILEAEDGPAALEVIAAANGIDLLLTDVILPRGMSGRDVAIAFLERYPAAGVLYSSGYTREILNRRGKLEPGVALMNKPYQTPALARRVREILDGR